MHWRKRTVGIPRDSVILIAALSKARFPERPTSHDRQSTAADTAVVTGVHFLPRAPIRKEGCRSSS